MSLLDALYFSTETVATVGYGDFNFIDQSPLLRLWAIFLMAAGVTTIAMLMAFLSDMLISRRLTDRSAAAGCGDVRARGGHRTGIVRDPGGRRAGRAGRQVVIVERDPANRFLSEAQRLGLPVIFGDATLRPTLDAARLADSSAVAVMTSNDMVNIETAIAVRDLFGSAGRSIDACRWSPGSSTGRWVGPWPGGSGSERAVDRGIDRTLVRRRRARP